MAQTQSWLGNNKFVLLTIGFVVLVSFLGKDLLASAASWSKIVAVPLLIIACVFAHYMGTFNAPGSTNRGTTSKGWGFIAGWIVPIVIAIWLIVGSAPAVN